MPYQLAQKEVVSLNAGFLNLVRTYSSRFGDRISHLLGIPADQQQSLGAIPTDTLDRYCQESRFMFFRPRQMVCCTTGSQMSSGKVQSCDNGASHAVQPLNELDIQICKLNVAYHSSANIIAKIMPQVCVDVFGVSWSCIPTIQTLSHYQIADICHTRGAQFEPRVPLNFLLHEDVEQGLNAFIAMITASFTRAAQPGAA